MKQLSLSYLLLLALLAAACHREETLVAEPDAMLDGFLPHPEATDAESKLRRDFYKEHGSFLLFSDTLVHRSLGRSSQGKEVFFTELIDIAYTVGADSPASSSYTFTYLPNREARQWAVRLLKEEVLPHLGAQLRPFSWLCVDSIKQTYYGDAMMAKVASGERCVAIAMSGVEKMDAAKRKAYAGELMAEILSGAMLTKAETEAFFEPCRDKYDQLDFGYFSAPDATLYSYSIGFLSKKKRADGEDWGSFCPSREQDLVAYLKLLFAHTDEQLNERFADYPLVKQKCAILRNLVQKMGFIS